MFESFTLMQMITFALAILGAVLGIMNTWRNFDKDRVKLKVVPGRAVVLGGYEDIELSISITNFSSFPVVITEVGVLYQGTKVRGAVPKPVILDGKEFPRKLEPRTSISTYMYSDILLKRDGHSVKSVYAITDCGIMIRGTSQALKQMIARS